MPKLCNQTQYGPYHNPITRIHSMLGITLQTDRGASWGIERTSEKIGKDQKEDEIGQENHIRN